jgi:phage terminase small subunit
MASDSRTLKLAILGEVKDLSASLTKGSKEVSSFGDKITKFGKIAGAAFAAAGVAAVAYAGKLAIDGVKAAIADEAAQIRLATSLKNVTGATDAQIKATEQYILKTSLAKGVTDDELRPSLDRLVKATKDVEAAQKLQAIAIDVAAGSGKSLEAVTNAMARAAEGNTASLGRLGIGLSKAELASMSMEEITAKLAKTFENQASKQADTFQGKMDRLKIAFDEGKETVGVFVLDAITPLVDFIVQKVVPGVQTFIDSIGGEKGISKALNAFVTAAKSIFIPVFQGIQFAFDKIKGAVSDNKEEFQALLEFIQKYVAPFLGGVFKIAIQGIGTAIAAVVDVVGALIRGFQTLISLGSKIGGAIGGMFGGGRAAGGPVVGGTTYLVGEQGPELFTPSGSGNIIPNGAFGGGGSNVINITVNGAIDPISTARQITQILNREATLSGTFNKVGASLLVGA